MMDNLTENKSHIPCQTWVGQNGWSTASTQGSLLNPLPSSQPCYNHMQQSSPSCMSDLSTLSPRNSFHQSAAKVTGFVQSNPSSNSLFANTAVPNISPMISFSQQTSHASAMLLNANQGKNIHPPSLTPTNQAPQTCRSHNLPLLSPHDPYKPSQTPLTNAGLPDGLSPVSPPTCGQHEQSQWIPSSHCRGAASPSVPDAKNKPSQERTISPAVNIDEQRLALLHQRALLLQQVAELDKLLELLPAEDSHDGKSPSKSIQFPPSMDDSSQSEQTETSDAEEVPEEKSMKEEHFSEDDKDSDYFPNSDVDFSDFLSDNDGGTSDESSQSRSSSPTKEKPSLPDGKRAKRGSSLFMDKSVSPQKKVTASNLKKSCQTLVLPCSNSKSRRVYDRRNYCLFCSKPISKMARHLEQIHRDKMAVAEAFQYPKNSRERQKIWNRLIKQGNFEHNKNVLKTGMGQMVSRKRPRTTQRAENFLHCLYCRGLYMKKALHRHMKLCPEKEDSENLSDIGGKRIALLCVLETIEDLCVSDGLRSILSTMTYDDVTRTVMEDEVILQFGELLLIQQGSNPKKLDYIRQDLRQIARLVLEAQKITPLQKLEDFFLPSSFPHVVSAVNVLAGYNPENKMYNIPSLAIKIGCHLQKTCSIVKGNAEKCGNASLAESARDFLSVYQKQWNKLISAGALATIRETKLIKDKKVPFTEDVKRLNSHMENVHLLAEKNLRDNASAQNYAALTRVILARTILFNRRSVGEISSMQLTAFMSRKKSNVLDGMDISVSDLEKTMCGFFTRVDIRGKCGRTVPVLLKPSFVSAMELLIKVRTTCGVPCENPFLFGRPQANSNYNGSECIQKYVKECGAKDPEALTLAKIRRHYGTMLQLINLDENEANQIFGPINHIYSLQQNSSMQLDDAGMDSDDLYHGQAHGTTGVNMTAKYGKGSTYKGKHKWEEAEVLAVERHMMHLIVEHKVPQKNDCIQCLEAEPEALRTRSWKGVKDYVRNRITALKRQNTTPQA